MSVSWKLFRAMNWNIPNLKWDIEEVWRDREPFTWITENLVHPLKLAVWQETVAESQNNRMVTSFSSWKSASSAIFLRAWNKRYVFLNSVVLQKTQMGFQDPKFTSFAWQNTPNNDGSHRKIICIRHQIYFHQSSGVLHLRSFLFIAELCICDHWWHGILYGNNSRAFRFIL